MDEAKAKAEHDAAVARGENPPQVMEEPELVSRPVQGGIGLFTGVTVYNVAFGGLFALAFAICFGRMGDYSPRVTAGLLALSGFIAVYAVPILKYPANPPSIGNPDTIGLRTAIYFGMILLSFASMVAAWRCPQSPRRPIRCVERDADRGGGLSRRGSPLRYDDAAAERGSGRLPRRGALAVPHGVARRAGDYVDGDRSRLRGLGRARFCAGEVRQAANRLIRRVGELSMTARLDLLAHGASSATRAARFPDDEPLEASAIAALETLRGRLRPYRRVLAAPARAARETASALGLDADIETALRDCNYGCWRGLASADVAAHDPDGFAAWLVDPAAAPHGGEPLAAVFNRASMWLGEALERDGATLAVTHSPVVRAAIATALGAAPRLFGGSMSRRSRLRD